MRIGIIGLPQVGKTTLLKILTSGHARAPHDAIAHVGVVRIPDPRLEALAKIYQPKKVTPAQLEFLDGPALTNEPEKDAAALAHFRQVDALAHVVRLFRDPNVGHLPGEVNPARDIAALETELVWVDLDTANKRLEKLEHDMKKARAPEAEHEHGALVKCRERLAAATPLRAVVWTAEERRLLRGFMFFTAKPLLHVLNAGEEDAARLAELPRICKLEALREQPAVGVTPICGKIEAELAELEAAEAAELRASYALQDLPHERLLPELLRTLELVTFFAVSEPECRAWLVHRGTTALEAAAQVHTDFAERFIKAEVIPWDQLVATGGLAIARAEGKIRLEGKDYAVADGDVLYIRHAARK